MAKSDNRISKLRKDVATLRETSTKELSAALAALESGKMEAAAAEEARAAQEKQQQAASPASGFKYVEDLVGTGPVPLLAKGEKPMESRYELSRVLMKTCVERLLGPDIAKLMVPNALLWSGVSSSMTARSSEP